MRGRQTSTSYHLIEKRMSIVCDRNSSSKYFPMQTSLVWSTQTTAHKVLHMLRYVLHVLDTVFVLLKTNYKYFIFEKVLSRLFFKTPL